MTTRGRLKGRALPPAIQEMARRITKGFNPERIILFGSYARGTAGPDSDADLLVVMEPKGSKREQATAIDVALLGIPLPADVLVVRPDEIAHFGLPRGSVLDEALREGVVLHEREHVG